MNSPHPSPPAPPPPSAPPPHASVRRSSYGSLAPFPTLSPQALTVIFPCPNFCLNDEIDDSEFSSNSPSLTFESLLEEKVEVADTLPQFPSSSYKEAEILLPHIFRFWIGKPPPQTHQNPAHHSNPILLPCCSNPVLPSPHSRLRYFTSISFSLPMSTTSGSRSVIGPRYKEP